MMSGVKRVTVTISEDLADAVDRYARSHGARPAWTNIIQKAMREYLAERGCLQSRRALRIRPASRGSGLRDVSEAHDRHVASR